MGIPRVVAILLLKESARRPFEGRVLTLGRQDILFPYSTLERVAKEVGVQLSNVDKISPAHKPELAAQGFMSDDSFFKSIGFSDMAAVDYSDYESARYIFDLNNPDVPEELVGAFDVIIDGGTIEHIFHLPNVLNNIYKMMRVGGRVIHVAPSSNHIDHGFYMFSPTLFWNFYEANKFEINTFHIFRYTPNYDVDPWEISDYSPGCLNSVSFGGLDDGMYQIYLVATKTEASTGDVVPQQRTFVNLWEGKDDAGAQEERSAPAPSMTEKIKGSVKSTPFLYRALRPLGRLVRSFRKEKEPPPRPKGLGLKVVARY